MKIIAAALLVFCVAFAQAGFILPGIPLPGLDGTVDTAATGAAPSECNGYKLLNKLNKLDTHYMTNCCKGVNARIRQAYMGPCLNTPSCVIPKCCGIIAGRKSIFKILYESSTNFTGGIFNGNIGGIAIGELKRNCTNYIPIDLPFQILVPPTLAGYRRTLCHQTTCPQTAGKYYCLDIPFRFCTTALTSLGIKANFVAEIRTEMGKQALCWGLWAELVNLDLIPSIEGVLGDITTGQILVNPMGTLKKPAGGLLGDDNTERWDTPNFTSKDF